MDKLTTAQAAELLEVNVSRVRQLILTGRLPAEKFGRDWLILRSDIESFQRKPRGYPKGKARKGTH